MALEASASALAQVVHLTRSPLFEMTIPSKLAFCLAAGRPLLAGVSGEAKAVAVESGAALCFEPESSEGFAEAIEKLLAHDESKLSAMGLSGRAYFENHFCFARLINAYRGLINLALGDKSVPSFRDEPLFRAKK